MTTTVTPPLRRAALPALRPEHRPLVLPGQAAPGIAHLGLGAFFRAHQAVYTEEALAAAGGDWGIVAVAPRSRAVVDALRAQDLLYSVTAADADRTEVRVVGALAGVRHAAADPLGVVALLADPRIRIVTLTVTEKAYALRPADGRLLLDAELRADLCTDRPPRTLPGLLVRGLLARARADAGPLAVVSCDNLPANGARLRGMVTQAVRAAGAPEDWIAAHVTFPGTTVDRIVPASTPETSARAAAALGVADRAAVWAEPYRQWVIEDDFPAGRPAWERAGAILTADAGPYERLKLRALNGVHSALAYLGALAGCETIADTLALPHARAFAERLLAEDLLPTVEPPPGVDPAAYGRTVLARFANPAVRHRTLQVAMDGTQKLPQRIVAAATARRAAGGAARWAALALAAWMRFVQGVADDGRPLPLADPRAAEIRAALAAAGPGPAGTVAALLALRAVFPPELAADAEFAAEVTAWLAALARHGAAAVLAEAR